MNAERFRSIEEIFHAAADLPPGERTNYINLAAGADADLTLQVRRLLSHHDSRGTFLEPPFPADSAASTPLVSPIGRRIGRYTITRILARGGMGVVYEAQQEKPLRRVALKVMQSSLASESARRRFEFESQILASLRHPHVAQVYEAGVHEDIGGAVPFFAMELVDDALPITGYCAASPAASPEPSASPPRAEPTLSEKLSLFLQACAAVHHGHQQGVIHRDLKPANILVDASGTVKVIDFGVARVTRPGTDDITIATDAGRVIGTLAYMSPEQVGWSPLGWGIDAQPAAAPSPLQPSPSARTDSSAPPTPPSTAASSTPPSSTPLSPRRSADIDTRSDVYSLGLILYELLCSRPPYEVRDRSLPEAAFIIATQAPVRPSSIVPSLRGDLETIILKSLEKDRERRYQSVEALARDIERFQQFEPIDARPATTIYQLRMFARRNRALVAASIAVACILIVATGVSVWFALVARAETSRAEKRADFLQGALASANPWFPPAFPTDDNLSDYEPWDEWQHSPWPYAGLPGRAASILDVMMAAGVRVPEEFGDDPLTRARLSDSLGWSLGRHLTFEKHPSEQIILAQAESLLRDALTIRREKLGDEHEDTIRSMERLAEFLEYTPTGGFEAEKIYDEAWKICRRLYGPEDSRTLHALRSWSNNVAFLQGRYQETIDRTLADIGWAADETVDAPPATLISLIYCARTVSRFDVQRGRIMAESAYRRLARDVGSQNIRTAYAGRYIFDVLMRAKDYPAAERIARDFVATESRFFGPQSLEVAHRSSALAQSLAAQNKWADAAAAEKATFDIFHGVRGPESYDTLTSQWAYAEYLWFARVDLPESERLALDAHAKWCRVLGPSHPHALNMSIRLADAAIYKGLYDRALVFIAEQLKHAEAEGVDPVYAFHLRWRRADCYIALARPAEALTALREGAALAKSQTGIIPGYDDAIAEALHLIVAGNGTLAP